ncbi:hypothetical protein C447_10042 [Halococcus hamelinensis 100A6]|uniref:DUF8159 domain-containing protein n=1 Tax=Halococcus hamelinensis 100A6 TaxID=1132509 RepID=M0LY22_9EURY|nr:hypothetical protein C447_10042 [Halococcus hamelinensis 100A6]
MESFDVRIHANTTLLNYDAEGDNGEPYFRVNINGEQVTATGQVDRADNANITVPMNRSVLSGWGQTDLNVTAILVDRDAIFDDEVTQWSTNVAYSPPPTPTPTETPTPTPTATEVASTPAEALPDTVQVSEAEVDTPTAIETETGDQGPEYYETLIQAGLSNEGVAVESVDTTAGSTYLEYTTISTTQGDLASEIGMVAGAYAFAIGDGYESSDMQVTVLGADGSEIGTYEVQSEWAEQYNNGEITGEEFSIRVLETLETETV